jgi:hypothetical protein
MPKQLQRRAEWIWRERLGIPIRGDGPWGRPDYEQDRNLYVYFRRAFDLAAAPREALAHVSADGRYRLFVNGTYVGRGPARCVSYTRPRLQRGAEACPSRRTSSL